MGWGARSGKYGTNDAGQKHHLNPATAGTRREFIRQAAVVSAAFTFGGLMDGIASDRKGKVLGANDRINIAVIGVNSRGKALAKNFSKIPQCEVTHLCDCDSNALQTCQAEVAKITQKAPIFAADTGIG